MALRTLPVVALVVAGLAGCGQDNRRLIDEARSEQLMATVDRIEAACSDQDPQAAQAAVDEANAQVNELPRRVDEGLKDNMREWLGQIQSRLERDCEPEEEPPPPPPPPAPTEEPTAEPTPEPTEEPTPEPTPEPTEEPPPEETPVPEPTPPIDDGGGVPAPDVPEEGDE
jgi:outer membrane biosynthesis protein TonB